MTAKIDPKEDRENTDLLRRFWRREYEKAGFRPCDDCVEFANGTAFCAMNCSAVSSENKIAGW